MPWHQTELTELLQISRPIIQAGMAGGIMDGRSYKAPMKASSSHLLFPADRHGESKTPLFRKWKIILIPFPHIRSKMH